MYKTWTTPSGEYSRLYADMLAQHHLLIAGSTGSGKSTAINGIIHAALYNSPAKVRFILIDPKRVELSEYASLPHTIMTAKGYNPDAWKKALATACNIMDSRYQDMEKRKTRMYNGSDIYVIIDEYALIAKSGGSECYKMILRLTSEGRAAKIHCIIATQVPKADIIRTEIRENMSARLCLRCNTKTESRVLMDVSGCENLPQYGLGYYIKACSRELYRLQRIEQSEIDRLVTYWTRAKPKRRLFAS